MFYVRHRPLLFKDVSRPSSVADVLLKQLAQDKSVHAYLFMGSRGTGKTTIARLLAKALSCSSRQSDGDACGVCHNCKSLLAGAHPDILEIDAASHRGIDDIRLLKEKISLAPTQSSKKVYIIDEVHMLTTEAFNSLLKTLEEPPRHSVFILCTTETHKVPETIKSRCQVFKFERASVSQIAKKLADICEKEGIKEQDNSVLHRIAQLANGSFRDAETMLQQVVEGNLDLSILSSTVPSALAVSYVESLLKKDCAKALQLLKDTNSQGVSLQHWASDVAYCLKDLLIIKSVGDSQASTLVQNDTSLYINAVSLVDKAHYSILLQYLEVFSEISETLLRAENKIFVLELATIKLCLLDGTLGESFIIKEDRIEDDSSSSARPKSASVSHNGPLESDVSESREETTQDMSENDIVPESSEEKKASESAVALYIANVLDVWPKLVDSLSSINSSIHALVKKANVLSVNGSTVHLEVAYAFHKERLESPKNRTLVEEELTKLLNYPVSIHCMINSTKRFSMAAGQGGTGELTDFNVTPVPASVDLAEIFDGALPM